jgi:hypothetical protein
MMNHANTIQRIAGVLSLLYMGLFAVVSTAQAQNEVVVTDDITSNTTWTNDNTYVLDGLVFVGPSTEGGQNLDQNVTLTIEPGTVIRGREDANVTTGESGSALVVRRSAQIDASGTPSDPIIFTSETDDISDPVDQLEGGDPDRGQWGGLIVLGEASTNQRDGNGNIIYNNQVEGIDPANNPALFGGGSASNEDDRDNSGTLQYVSIRYGGFAIGAGDEVNGLTLGAVGRGTTIDHIEVYANDDDGVEWFGGTVHADHLLTAFVGDDGFDYDQGYRGTGQFWMTIHDADEAGRGGEHDGSDAGTLSDTPYARPVITNATYIGSGQGASPSGDGNDTALQMRDFAGGEYYNSVFTDYPDDAVFLNDDGTGENYGDNDIVFENNAFYGFGAGDAFGDIITIANSSVTSDFADGQTSSFNGNLISSSVGVQSIDRTQTDVIRNLDPRPIGEIANQSTTPKSDFLAKTTSGDGNGSVGDGQGSTLSKSEYLDPIQNVSYHGAVNPNVDVGNTWAAGWTALFQNRLYLPVEMANFEVQKDGESFVLAWATASETNNAGFDVQRSVNGGPFETIGFREGAGTTEQGRTYRFTDANVPFEASTIEYRLRQKDLDGSTEVGPTRTAELSDPNKASLLSPFPNPTTERATVRYTLPEDGTVTLSVYNVLGQRVATLVDGRQSAGRKQRTLDTSSFGSGVYFLRLNTKDEIVTERLTIVR